VIENLVKFLEVWTKHCYWQLPVHGARAVQEWKGKSEQEMPLVWLWHFSCLELQSLEAWLVVVPGQTWLVFESQALSSQSVSMQGVCDWLSASNGPGRLENLFGCPAQWDKHQSAREKLDGGAQELHHAGLAGKKRSFTVFLESLAAGALLHEPSLARSSI
jgi:hypothetical protein